MKPRVFIGSSTKALPITAALHATLEHDAEVTGWNDAVFEPSKFTLETLLEQLGKTDFAIFVFNPDDLVTIQEIESQAVRDNVLFEFGLFMGCLGRERCFILQPRESKNLHIASDLLGLTPLKFESNREDKNLVAALVSPTVQIRQIINQLGLMPSSVRTSVPSSFTKGSASWLAEHLDDVRTKIIGEAESLAATEGRDQVRPTDIARATSKFAPGGPVRGSWFADRVLGSLSGVSVVAALLAVVFGALGVYTNQTAYFDLVKLFAGTVLGSAGATAVVRNK